MVKRLASVLVLLIIALGMTCLALDILDIDEDYRLFLSIPLLNTVFIFVIAVLVAYFATRSYLAVGAPVILGLGGAALAFGMGSLFKSWANLGLDVTITVDESAALIASILHLVTAHVGIFQKGISDSESRGKSRLILGYYLGVIVCIALVIWLVHQSVIPSFAAAEETSRLLRDIVAGITSIFLLAAAVINFINYYKSGTGFYYWYALGLVLFAFGVFFISQGAVESRVAWLGRTAHYFGGIYFLISVTVSYWMAKKR